MKRVGSRAEVMHGTAYRTTGGLKKGDLMYKNGRIVSRRASEASSMNWENVRGRMMPPFVTGGGRGNTIPGRACSHSRSPSRRPSRSPSRSPSRRPSRSPSPRR
jgi:hypothetical protein